ncbi:tRNA glutamyl-Q(34) synthetase GluQRS [Endozoicomonas euniceicola]|uniref:Glutamyl-Q tRNA(Asp) synthetase n=1 Tax=Endozoicomonas euniceicola TaxID=1234143 RepID=A0ABY6H1B3_9GAMM|nr:tRNA glutamyl-Q(34) synthetase GluQRS [Endozoicomonas euniceicola]UYM18705.1 tRNA glutamyl-Q(34) synthetase GluQRS [Endozoicomonas euniceicola]
MTASPYIGRFAPSPTGPLHFGSLVAALASYLDARHQNGTWLVRMEDIDPPREQPGAASKILKALEVYGLHWDGEILYQSQRSSLYEDAIEQLRKRQAIYPCVCSRKQLQPYHGIYPGLCRSASLTDLPDKPYAWRLNSHDEVIAFNDRIQGQQRFDMKTLGDFIVKRKEKLYAYQLAVCVDDEFQKITHIVRGHDLIDSTPRQISLQSALGMNRVTYAHIPVIVQDNGDKLSKQNLAPELSLDEPRPLLAKALQALGQQPPKGLKEESIEDIINWGMENWNLNKIARSSSLPESDI